MAKRTLPQVNCTYGAPMGRRSRAHPGLVDEPMKFYLQRVPLDSGGYDSGGAYWGHGQPLYWYTAADTPEMAEFKLSDLPDAFLRANNRKHAKELIREMYPLAKFFR